MKIDHKSFTQHILFWLLIAFIAGFGFSEVLTRTGLNPLRSSAFMPGDDTIFCGPGGNAEEMGYVCGNPYHQTNNGTQTDVNVLNGGTAGTVRVIDDPNDVPTRWNTPD